MKNSTKRDDIFVNVITHDNEVKAVSKKPVGKASDEPSCIYAHKRHGVGSKIINTDGSESICQGDSVWKNMK